MDESGEENGSAFVAGGEAAKGLEAIEVSLDTTALLVGDTIVRDGDLADAVGRDNRFCVHGIDRCSQGISVIGFIGQNGLTLLAIQKPWSLRDLCDLSCGHDKAQGATERIGSTWILVVNPPLERPGA